ncbi:hypothetical protein [Kitasatospora sp. NPDC017646]|uniref:hypothetical protein n=1 Tax=Kitasatospora sp. NPDC017646 TaxID=3364024 RepID=UPI00378B9F1B
MPATVRADRPLPDGCSPSAQRDRLLRRPFPPLTGRRTPGTARLFDGRVTVRRQVGSGSADRSTPAGR